MIGQRSLQVKQTRWQRVRYRLRQFVQGFSAQISATEREKVAQLLPADAVALFARMPPDAQRHSLNVLSTVQAAGYTQPDLWVAALLHDVGKVAAADAGVRLSLWLRGPLVILAAVVPMLLDRLASADPRHGWRYLLYVHQAHPGIGALWAKEAGCTADACWLIEHHQVIIYPDAEPPLGIASSAEQLVLLRALQQADEMN